MKRKTPPFEAYGFTEADYEASRASIWEGAPEPDARIVKRIDRWCDDVQKARDERRAVVEERKRQFVFAFSTVVGLVSIVLLTLTFARDVHMSTRVALDLATLALFGSILAFLGREFYRKK
jgi:hypothetical protein